MIHTLPLERRTLHGYFSRELPPALTVDPGDSVRFSTLDAGWGTGPPTDATGARPRFAERDREFDLGVPTCGPIEVRGAQAGGTLAVTIDSLRVGSYGLTFVEGGEHVLVWELDAEQGIGRDQLGREVSLRPFLGTIGMPPPEPGVHSNIPPRLFGGNLDCSELVASSTLYLPIPVDGALLSLGDAHARQGDGEVSGTAIECPVEEAVVTLKVRGDLELAAPVARTPDGWIAFGLDEDLDLAAEKATAAMVALMGRLHGIDAADALALASVGVDLRVTQVVDGVKGVHAVLRDDAIRFPGMMAAL